MLTKLPPDIQRQVDRGICILKRGGIIAFRTDTVYGLGACANRYQAVERVYQVKERPRNMALPLLLARISQINEVAEPVPPIAWPPMPIVGPERNHWRSPRRVTVATGLSRHVSPPSLDVYMVEVHSHRSVKYIVPSLVITV